jgi:copper homeostasis protein
MNAGARGIVFGCLTPHGSIAREQCAELLQIARGQAVFHRAFDFLTDRNEGLQTLIDLGFTRVLTSGGAASAEAGTPALAALVAQAANRIEVLPCGRVRASNVGSLVRNTGCNQVHAAPRLPVADISLQANPPLAESMGTTTTIDRDAVRELRKQLDELQLR